MFKIQHVGTRHLHCHLFLANPTKPVNSSGCVRFFQVVCAPLLLSPSSPSLCSIAVCDGISRANSRVSRVLVGARRALSWKWVSCNLTERLALTKPEREKCVHSFFCGDQEEESLKVGKKVLPKVSSPPTFSPLNPSLSVITLLSFSFRFFFFRKGGQLCVQILRPRPRECICGSERDNRVLLSLFRRSLSAFLFRSVLNAFSL